MLISVSPADSKVSFYMEAKASDPTTDVTRLVLENLNLVMFLLALREPLADLARHGPLRRPEHKGLSEVQEGEEPFGPCVDEHMMRTGHAPDTRGKELLQQAVDAITKVCVTMAAAREPLTRAALDDALDVVKGTVMMVYPQGLAEHDAVAELIDAADDYVSGRVTTTHDYYCVDEGAVFFAGKSLVARGQDLSCLRCSDSTTIKLIPSKSQSYVPRSTDDTQRAELMRYAFEREKRSKAAELNAGDDDLTEQWADPRSLKMQLQGRGDIRFN